jgi:hypothetical protein
VAILTGNILTIVALFYYIPQDPISEELFPCNPRSGRYISRNDKPISIGTVYNLYMKILFFDSGSIVCCHSRGLAWDFQVVRRFFRVWNKTLLAVYSYPQPRPTQNLDGSRILLNCYKSCSDFISGLFCIYINTYLEHI